MGCVAVVGAGPAGCSAAVALAAVGQCVHLFERGVPGKDKPCGDALLPDAVLELRALSVETDSFRGGGGSPFQCLDLWDARQRIWSLPLGPDQGWVMPRATVDQALRDVAGRTAQVSYQSMVQRIDWDDGRWYVTVDGRVSPYDAVVLATGATNALSRLFGVAGQPIIGASISAYGEHDECRAPLFQFAPLGGAGYGWVFPLASGRVNIGVCAVKPGAKRLRSAMMSYLQRWDITTCGPLRGGGGPFWSDMGEKWHDHRGLVSCGDAAGLVDPLTGEGIAAALHNGRAAGRAVAVWLLEGRDLSALSSYSDWVLATFRARYAATPARRCWDCLNQTSGG